MEGRRQRARKKGVKNHSFLRFARYRGQVLDSFCLKDINTPGRARIHQVSSRRDRLRYLNAFLLCVPFLICI